VEEAEAALATLTQEVSMAMTTLLAVVAEAVVRLTEREVLLEVETVEQVEQAELVH
jgi:hypothetical protein